MKIIPLSEGAFTVDASKKFVPFNVNEDKLKDRSGGSLLVEIQPFVIILNNDIILLDTGLGLFDADGKLQLYKNLSENGINANDITKVVMSHLHKDHAGALLNPNTNLLSFENATYHIQKQELDFALGVGSASYDRGMLEGLKRSEQIVLEENLRGLISDNISYEVTGAHSKFHRVLWIKDEEEIAFFGGDDAPQYSQMITKFAAKYDYNGKKAMNLRKDWIEKGIDEKWQFLFYHDIKIPVYIFAK